jgi:hypothetical protein
LKKINKISSLFIAVLAILILFVSSFSVAISNNIETIKKISKTEKTNQKQQAGNKFYFSKSSIEAVFSQIVPCFDAESVVFLNDDFQFLLCEKPLNYAQFITRQLYLEVLFEHLNAPNAP